MQVRNVLLCSLVASALAGKEPAKTKTTSGFLPRIGIVAQGGTAAGDNLMNAIVYTPYKKDNFIIAFDLRGLLNSNEDVEGNFGGTIGGLVRDGVGLRLLAQFDARRIHSGLTIDDEAPVFTGMTLGGELFVGKFMLANRFFIPVENEEYTLQNMNSTGFATGRWTKDKNIPTLKAEAGVELEAGVLTALNSTTTFKLLAGGYWYGDLFDADVAGLRVRTEFVKNIGPIELSFGGKIEYDDPNGARPMVTFGIANSKSTEMDPTDSNTVILSEMLRPAYRDPDIRTFVKGVAYQKLSEGKKQKLKKHAAVNKTTKAAQALEEANIINPAVVANTIKDEPKIEMTKVATPAKRTLKPRKRVAFKKAPSTKTPSVKSSTHSEQGKDDETQTIAESENNWDYIYNSEEVVTPEINKPKTINYSASIVDDSEQKDETKSVSSSAKSDDTETRAAFEKLDAIKNATNTTTEGKKTRSFSIVNTNDSTHMAETEDYTNIEETERKLQAIKSASQNSVHNDLNSSFSGSPTSTTRKRGKSVVFNDESNNNIDANSSQSLFTLVDTAPEHKEDDTNNQLSPNASFSGSFRGKNRLNNSMSQSPQLKSLTSSINQHPLTTENEVHDTTPMNRSNTSPIVQKPSAEAENQTQQNDTTSNNGNDNDDEVGSDTSNDELNQGLFDFTFPTDDQ